MILLQKIVIFFLTVTLLSCLTDFHESTTVNKTIPLKVANKQDPKVAVRIAPIDSVLNHGDEIWIEISLTNKSSEVQKLLFDKPNSGFVPWATSGKVTDIKTNQSVLEYENRGILSSRAYLEEELKEMYYNLKPEGSLSALYKLSDIVEFNTSDNLLPIGKYKVQLFYNSNPSNILEIQIR